MLRYTATLRALKKFFNFPTFSDVLDTIYMTEMSMVVRVVGPTPCCIDISVFSYMNFGAIRKYV